MYTPPKLIPEFFSINDKAPLCKITIKDDNYIFCETMSKNMWANKKTGNNYNKGFLNNEEDPHKTERIGRLGEFALASIFQIQLNDEYVEGGDEFDFILNNKKVDIKTASKKPFDNTGIFLGKTNPNVVYPEGRLIKPSSDIYFFSYIENDDIINKLANVVIVGWIKKENINTQLFPSRSNKSNHKNYEVNYSTLKSVQPLYNKYWNVRNIS